MGPWISLQLMELAKGRLVLALEGGYNPISIANSYLACMHALLHDPYPECSGLCDLLPETLPTIEKVIQYRPLCTGTVMCIVLGLCCELKLLGGGGSVPYRHMNYLSQRGISRGSMK